MQYKEGKVSVVGDIHLSLRSGLAGQNDWERDRFIELFNHVALNDSAIVVLNGDIFDKAKVTYEEVGLFFEGIQILNDADKDVYVTDGNHEELSKDKTTFDYLPHSGFIRVKTGAISFEGVDLWLVGHPYISYIEKDLLPISYDRKNVLLSHYRSDIGYAPSEIDNELVSDRFNDAVLSDIHYRLTPAHNIQYTSSPYGIHFTPDKDYGYCTIDIKNGDYKIDFIKLNLPSKVKLTVKQSDLKETLKTLDIANKYNIEITGVSSSESLVDLADNQDVITKFKFSDLEDDIMEVVTDDLREAGNVSVSDIIMVALDDVELTIEELDKAKKFLKEVL